ncbi:MAG: glycosyltransferase [Gemmataceae bacterium]|nr:glycosyltransferase [Gemmataceae bacterium]
MLTDWTYWLSLKHPDQLLLFLWALLLVDGQRYALSKILLCWCDCGCNFWNWLRGGAQAPRFTHCPTVCVILAGHNEAETIDDTLRSLWGSYPRLEIIVVDDGSTDDMAAVARRFARAHAGVLVLQRPQRGGKSSAMNFARAYTRAEVLIVVDADSHLGPAAIWEMVQPFHDPRVGAVAGTVAARNPFTNLVTVLQAYEYLSTVFVGRMLTASVGLLGIVSGAFGAFRRTALDRVKGWDVGPPEDLDLTLTLRKSGYEIAFAPYAQCFTELPESWWALIQQRLRWERSGVIRNHCRKHLDLACFWQPHGRWLNGCVLLESWLFNIFCMYGIWAWIAWFCLTLPPDGWQMLLAVYLCYLVFEMIQVLAILYYSTALARDAVICGVFFLLPFYQLVLLTVRLVATTEEIFLRKSFADNYVPAKVRTATWHW